MTKILIFLLLSGSGITASAQEADSAGLYQDHVRESDDAALTREEKIIHTVYNNHSPTPAQWQQATSDKAFGYKNETEYHKTPEKKPYREPAFIRFLMLVFQFFASTGGRIILFGLLALIIGYIIYRILSGEGKKLFHRAGKKMKPAEEERINEADLLTNNWEERLQDALQKGDQRLAIRYSYMLLLQLLQQHNLISYRQDKTNIEYYRELTDQATRQSFRDLMRQYEYTWYGNFPPAPPAFTTYFETFNNLKQKLRSW